MNTIGIGLQQLNREACKAQSGLDFNAEQDAKDSEDALKKLLASVGPVLGLYLGNIHIDVDGTPAAPSGGGPSGGGGRGSAPTSARMPGSAPAPAAGTAQNRA